MGHSGNINIWRHAILPYGYRFEQEYKKFYCASYNIEFEILHLNLQNSKKNHQLYIFGKLKNNSFLQGK